MISELFSRRPFIKILFSHLTISISRFRIIIYFSEIFAKFSQKIFKIFPGKSYIHTYTTYPPPISLTHTQYIKLWTHSELQIHFSQKHIFSAFQRLFPTPFTSLQVLYLYSNLSNVYLMIFNVFRYLFPTPFTYCSVHLTGSDQFHLLTNYHRTSTAKLYLDRSVADYYL